MLELFRKYRVPLLAACIVLAALLIYSANLRDQERTTLFERSVLTITAPIQKSIDSVWQALADWWGHYLWLIQTEQQNDLLLAENRQLRSELEDLAEIRLANERLHRLLEFRQSIDLPALPAQVIGEDASSWFRTVVIDKGSEHGLREGLPVVVAEGAVGRIIRCSLWESRVLLITDASSAVASLVQKSRTRGIARGQGETISLDFALRRELVEVGDKIITSGTGGVFPKGLTIGRVARVVKNEHGLFQEVTVVPAVDFSRLEEVLVLLRDAG
jgi:rod shape-determining protein MreC